MITLQSFISIFIRQYPNQLVYWVLLLLPENDDIKIVIAPWKLGLLR